ncbi:acyltransferase family protein [Sinosporangium siamense]|uniref:Acyltransferase n=1 Tax=Sinosporangium siamense TaxID=1367973 RepID=A0A919RNU0_9ACTN|nr:acyltransferase family protein [Sinosporangium siamense]GII96275.1 acyltransferase [Sinosporangium siamense]
MPSPLLEAPARPGLPSGTPLRPAEKAGARRSAAIRDPFIDILRVFGMALVVLQHWTMPMLAFDGERITTGNALSSPGMFVVTWISQVMPLVFFAGGAANGIAWRRATIKGEAAPSWLAVRLRRLSWPLLPLAAVWLPLPHLLHALGVPGHPVDTAARLAGQLLWFLAVYLIAVTVTPLMLKADMLYGWRVIVALVAGAVAGDLLRFGTGIDALGYANVIFVWLAVHQLGLRYSEGRLPRTGPWPWIMTLAGFGTAAALVALGPYPGSMIGMPGAAVSNMAPPTLALLAVCFGQIGLALLLRTRINRLAARPRVAAVAAWAAPRMMTVYLWHMTALAVVTGVVIVGVGFSTPTPWTFPWFAGWPLWLALLAGALWPLLRCFAKFEKPAALPYGTPGVLGIGVALGLTGAGILTLMISGFVPGPAPLLGTLALVAGIVLTLPRAR